MGTICAPNYNKIFMGKFEKIYIYPHIIHYQTFTVDLLITYTLFLSSILINNSRLKGAKNQADAK